MPESTQKKLSRIRPPRVQITYDVEIGDAIQMKELPFVAGILADLSGKPAQALPKLKDRKFVEIDRDNFNEIMKAIGPRLALRVDNKLVKGEGNGDGNEKLSAVLNFSNIDDFSPLAVLKQIKPLADLFEARTKLADLLTKLDGNDALDALLRDVVKNSEGMQQIKASIGGNGDGQEG